MINITTKKKSLVVSQRTTKLLHIYKQQIFVHHTIIEKIIKFITIFINTSTFYNLFVILFFVNPNAVLTK